MLHCGNFRKPTIKTTGGRWLSRFLGATVVGALCLLAETVRAGDKLPAVLVVVNGDSITSADLDYLLISSHQSMDQMQRQDFDFRKLLDRLVNDRLLIQEAVALGIHEDPRLVEMLDKRRDKQAVSRWVKDHYQADVTIEEATLWDYYIMNYARRLLRVVVVRTEEDAAAVFAALRNGADMDSLAREQSIDSYKATGGLRKMTYYLDLEPALRAQTDGMAVGEFSAPFSYRSVFALVRLEQDLPADTSAFEATRPKIESWLKKQESNRKWNAFVASVRDQLNVSVDSAALAAIASDSVNLFTPEFSEGTDHVLIRTGQEVRITDSEFRKEIGHMAMSSTGLPYQGLYQNTLNKVNEMIVLISAAYRDGYHELPELEDIYNRSLDSALVEIYVRETVLPRLTFRRDEFEAYYQEHLEDFKLADECQFESMTVDSAHTANEIARLLHEGADFRYVSKQYGVRLGTPEESTEWMAVTYFPDTIRQEIDRLRVGECTSPHQTGDGWVILKLRARRMGPIASLDEVESRIREVMFQQKFDGELDSVMVMLKEHADIRYDEKAIKEYFGDDS